MYKVISIQFNTIKGINLEKGTIKTIVSGLIAELTDPAKKTIYFNKKGDLSDVAEQLVFNALQGKITKNIKESQKPPFFSFCSFPPPSKDKTMSNTITAFYNVLAESVKQDEELLNKLSKFIDILKTTNQLSSAINNSRISKNGWYKDLSCASVKVIEKEFDKYQKAAEEFVCPIKIELPGSPRQIKVITQEGEQKVEPQVYDKKSIKDSIAKKNKSPYSRHQIVQLIKESPKIQQLKDFTNRFLEYMFKCLPYLIQKGLFDKVAELLNLIDPNDYKEKDPNIYQQIQGLRRELASAFNAKGLGLREEGHYQEALQHFNKASFFNNTLKLQRNIGYTFESMGQLDKAYDVLTKITRDYQKDYRGYLALAELQQKQGAVEAALDSYTAALQHCSQSSKRSDIYLRRAYLYVKLNDIKKAKDNCYCAKSLNQKNQVLDNVQGIVCWANGELEAASAYFSKSLENSSDAMLNLAGVYVQQGKYVAAEEVLKKAKDYLDKREGHTKLDPKIASCLQNIAKKEFMEDYFALVSLYLNKKDMIKALDTLEKITQRFFQHSL